jgi:hypothetical protein
MRSSRIRGYGSWTIGWREAERLPSGPPHKPGDFFWCFIALIMFVCIKVVIQGHPFAILIGFSILAGTIKAAR